MKMTQEQVNAAVSAGLSLTDPEADLLDTFRKHAPGVLMLRQILGGLASGTLALQAVVQEAPPKEPNKTPRKTPRKKGPTKRRKK